MMIGLSHPTVDIPPWPLFDEGPSDDTIPSPCAPVVGGGYSPLYALRQFLPSNHPNPEPDPDSPDSIACDEFRMYEFKVRRCTRDRSHDWTDCPFAHPGEKARRRDPRKFHYSGTACPDFRKGACRKGDACEYAHGVFECWLHPARYRTQPCKDGIGCRRKVCFFAHSADQLRVLTPPTRSPGGKFLMSPEAESPPMSPSSEAGALAAVIRGLQLGKARSTPSSLGARLGFGVSPSGFSSLPVTPTQVMGRLGPGIWGEVEDEEPVMERVESGRGLRARIFERIRKDNGLITAAEESGSDCPDVGWVSDLIK
ncbi:hypothetical protein MLD38_006887 [Melastoma candidum]|uniref:Uncharacterized protein n=1 Tax=Melastoma candidum TaxID=119954 RepID=A0ACB9RR79_9MYRT|nr:hypothetical protein MLD38_006887 [Melastoma candidum]